MTICGHFVAYIDILGTSEQIKNSGIDDDSHLNWLKQIFNQINKTIQKRNQKLDQNGRDLHGNLLTMGYRIFSDNIVIFKNIDRYGKIELRDIVNWVAQFQGNALSKGFLTRGGIAQGEFYNDETLVYGKALLEAIHLEENIAVYPRVVLNLDIHNSRVYQTCLDTDGFRFVNYFEHARLALDTNAVFGKVTKISLKILRDHMLNLMQTIDIRNIKILQKYLWLLIQYNNYCKKQNINSQLIDITQYFPA